MSAPLTYAKQCEECGRLMRPGTLVDFVKDSKGQYRYMHAGTCEEPVADSPPPPAPLSFQERFDTRECSHCGEWAYNKGQAPDRCHACGRAWLNDMETAHAI